MKRVLKVEAACKKCFCSYLYIEYGGKTTFSQKMEVATVLRSRGWTVVVIEIGLIVDTRDGKADA